MRLILILATFLLTACGGGDPTGRVQATGTPPDAQLPAKPSAPTPEPPQAASKAEVEILNSAAMYVEFERQAAELAKPLLPKPRTNDPIVGGNKSQTGVFTPAPGPQSPGAPPTFNRGFGDRNQGLINSVLAGHDAEVQAIAEAAKLLGIPAPTGALDDDHKAYLGVIKGPDNRVSGTSFAAEQTVIHSTMIGEVEAFLNDNPDTRLRRWAEGFLATLKARLKDVQATN
ncbi:MAG TPA: hypothetical protein VG942_05070 [Hyphomonadaceae bacterium]|nr:hypothetical protein [Hyphomonadaceae bacterium]